MGSAGGSYAVDCLAIGMTTLNRVMELYIDGAKYGGADALLDGKRSSSPNSRPSFMAGDRCGVKLLFRSKPTDLSATSALELDAGATIVMSAKTASGTDLLFSVSTFAASGSEDDKGYAGTLDLNTAECLAATASLENNASVSIYIDVEVRDAGNTERLTYRVQAYLHKQIYSSEVAPGTVDLPAAILVAPGGSRWQIGVDDNGLLTMTRVT